jgi:hypothetical protein
LAGAMLSHTSSGSDQPEWNDPISIRFIYPIGIAYFVRDQSILVTDYVTHGVFRVPLPDRMFVKV